jgi:hypothetical protein
LLVFGGDDRHTALHGGVAMVAADRLNAFGFAQIKKQKNKKKKKD